MNYDSRDRLAILAGARTPQAKAFGSLSDYSAVSLAQMAIQAALAKAELSPERIDETVIGNVASPADSANVARVIALNAGVPVDRIAHTVNRNCASGMESAITAWHILNEGRAQIILAGGTESMSNIPLLVRDSLKQKLLRLARSRSLLQKLTSSLRLRPKDFRPVSALEMGLSDPTCGLNMGETAELLAREFGVSREQQDAFALESHRRATAASDRCFMSGEIVPVKNSQREISKDVGPRKSQSMEQLAKLKPIFDPAGSVTPGNSCPLTDGATALLLCKESFAKQRGLHPLGYVSSYAIAGCDPKRMGLGPVFATAQLLKKTGLGLHDFDLVEINEAFAAQVLACEKAFASKAFAQQFLDNHEALGEIDPSKRNVHGGAIALGHPLGATGARLILTLARALRERNAQRGLATLCVGGGQGVSMIIEA